MSAVSVTNKELARFSFAYNTIIWKLFGIKCKNDVQFVQYYCNFLDFSHLFNYHRYWFLNKLFARGLLTSRNRIDEADMNELLHLSATYNLLLTDSRFILKRKIWNLVESKIFT